MIYGQKDALPSEMIVMIDCLKWIVLNGVIIVFFWIVSNVISVEINET